MAGNFDLAKQAGWVSLIGGCTQIVYGLLAIFFPYGPDIYHGWDEVLWIVASIGMAGAIFGLLILNAGQPRWLAWGGGILALLGVLIRIVASILIIARSSWDPLMLILLSILLVLGGMLALGIAMLRGNKLKNWRSWTPLLVSISGLIVTAIFSLNLVVHFVLLGLWGLAWMLVGYVVIENASQQDPRGHSLVPELQ